MARATQASCAAVLLSAAATFLMVSGCGDASAPATGGSSGVSSGGISSSGDSSTSTSGAGKSDGGKGLASGGAAPRGGEQQAVGGALGGPSAAGSGSIDEAAGAGAGGAAGDVPGPTPGGKSVYAVECSGETAMCGASGVHCLGLTLDTGKVGYACSNHCETIADCSDAPSGAEARAGCVPFTKEKRCMLVCYSEPSRYACPQGMDCYVYPNAPIGYCVWSH